MSIVIPDGMTVPERRLTSTSRRRDHVVEVIRTFFPVWKAQKDHAEYIGEYAEGNHPLPISPVGKGNDEQQILAQIARTPWGTLIINTCVQVLKVTGLRSADDEEGLSPLWDAVWKWNRMVSRQAGIIRPAIAYGASYTAIFPGERGINRDLGPKWDIMTPRTTTAFYAEDGDEWPMVALEGIEQEDDRGPYLLFRVIDEQAVHFAIVRDPNVLDPNTMNVTYLESRDHPADVTPVVLHRPINDDDAPSKGELMPFLPVIHRLDQTVYDRLVIQRNAAWKVRTAAGIKRPKTTEEERIQQQKLKAGDLLVAEDPGAKFGTLDASSMNEHIGVHEADLRDLSAISQTPPYQLLGLASNMAPESLAAVTSGFHAKIEGYQVALGESFLQDFELSAHVHPAVGQLSPEAEARWKGFRPYSLTQVADALGKLAQQLQVPVEMLWERIPNFTEEDIKRAGDLKAQAEAEMLAQAEAEGAVQAAEAARQREAAVAADAGQNRR